MRQLWFTRRARVRTGAVVGGLLLAAVAMIPQAAGAQTGGDPLVVRTADGLVQGKSVGTTDEYLGIPYAAAPVGPLRWQPPVPAAHWSGVREATAFAPNCAQPASPFGMASTSEDCLYLNVYTPAGAGLRGRTLPVMVWIHGGALITGESNDYDPAALVRDGVVVVTMNYRLGALGFLADSALTESPGSPDSPYSPDSPDSPGGASGNYGLMDQQAALHWVQSNVGRFGGDAQNVTLSGESAGGLSVLSQLASPVARGLFDRAIVESGTYNLVQNSLAAAETSGQAFAVKAGCAAALADATRTAQVAACLRALPVQTILNNENFAGYRPNVDGFVLPETLQSAFASGRFAQVPVLIGTNHDESTLFVAEDELKGESVTPADYQTMISATLGVSAQAAGAIAARYPVGSYANPALALSAVDTDATFACTALDAEESLSKYVPTYAYEFNDKNAPQQYLPSAGFPYGAAHTVEVQYLFALTAPFPGTLTADQQQLATDMRSYWTGLAKDGHPSRFWQTYWPRFHSDTQLMMSLDTPDTGVETDFAADHHCGFWSAAG